MQCNEIIWLKPTLISLWFFAKKKKKWFVIIKLGKTAHFFSWLKNVNATNDVKRINVLLNWWRWKWRGEKTAIARKRNAFNSNYHFFGWHRHRMGFSIRPNSINTYTNLTTWKTCSFQSDVKLLIGKRFDGKVRPLKMCISVCVWCIVVVVLFWMSSDKINVSPTTCCEC